MEEGGRESKEAGRREGGRTSKEGGKKEGREGVGGGKYTSPVWEGCASLCTYQVSSLPCFCK